MTTTGPNTLTYAETGANSTSSGGNVSYLTGGYALYPMAEVLGVYNATKSVDGQMTLAANNVVWAPNDAVEKPHYFQENVAPTRSLSTRRRRDRRSRRQRVCSTNRTLGRGCADGR